MSTPENPDPTAPLPSSTEAVSTEPTRSFDPVPDAAAAPASAPDGPTQSRVAAALAVDDAPDTPARPERRAFRMRTLVMGLIFLVVAGAVLLAQLTDVNIDPGLVILGLMVAAGLMLIAGAARS